MGKQLTKISGLLQITPPFEIKEDRDIKGVVSPIFGSPPLLSPLSLSIFKFHPCIVPFFSEDALCPRAFRPIFILDPAFFFPYKSFHQKASSYRNPFSP
jgi:hypothetical protein